MLVHGHWSFCFDVGEEVLIDAVPSEDVPGGMSDGAQIVWAYRFIRRTSWGSSSARRVRRSRDVIDQRFLSG
ncbi:MAG: hypothetical protein QM711_04760 [Micropruina sp.]|uniref:hypothetical protein n=1 Tax=Micropruina sp. TaxID=2737536 RepID=UPI0039E65ED3